MTMHAARCGPPSTSTNNENIQGVPIVARSPPGCSHCCSESPNKSIKDISAEVGISLEAFTVFFTKICAAQFFRTTAHMHVGR
jgi:hypothetical protein